MEPEVYDRSQQRAVGQAVPHITRGLVFIDLWEPPAMDHVSTLAKSFR